VPGFSALAEAGSTLPPKESVQLLRAARIARMQGDFAAELAKLQEALEAFPEDVTPIFALLEYRRTHGSSAGIDQKLHDEMARRLDELQQQLSSAVLFQLIADPDLSDEVLVLLAGHLTTRTQGTAAHAEAGRLLEALARIQQRLGLRDAAATTLIKLSKQRGTESQLWPLLGLLTRLERWSELAEYLQTLIDSGTPDLRSQLAYALARAGKFEEVLAQFKALDNQVLGYPARVSGDAVRSMNHVAWIARDAGRDDVAETLFRQALEVDPEDEAIQAVLLHLYGSRQDQQRLALAEADRRAAESDPQTLLDEGTQLLAAGDVDTAIELLKRAAPYFPELEAVWYNLGMAGYRLGDWGTAETAFAKAVDLNPGRAQSYYFRGISLVQAKRCSEAIEPLLIALELDANRTLAHYYLMVCYQMAGKTAEEARNSTKPRRSRRVYRFITRFGMGEASDSTGHPLQLADVGAKLPVDLRRTHSVDRFQHLPRGVPFDQVEEEIWKLRGRPVLLAVAQEVDEEPGSGKKQVGFRAEEDAEIGTKKILDRQGVLLAGGFLELVDTIAGARHPP